MSDPKSEITKRTSEVTLYKQATDVAGLCRDIVVKKAVTIGDRRFVPVEAWTTIAVAHGCIASIRSVTVTPEGVVAIAEIKRQSDGVVLTSAEGFVGVDEPTWYGGEVTRWNKFKKCEETKTLPRREMFAIRAMAQTRAVSRACRTAFSHVVVLMDAGLQTTPLEEVSNGDDEPLFEHEPQARPEMKQAEQQRTSAHAAPADAPAQRPVDVPRDADLKLQEQFRGGKWKKVKIHFGKNSGAELGALEESSLKWYVDEWKPKPFGNKPISQDDVLLRTALDVAGQEELK